MDKARQVGAVENMIVRSFPGLAFGVRGMSRGRVWSGGFGGGVHKEKEVDSMRFNNGVPNMLGNGAGSTITRALAYKFRCERC